jgi:hypothetical protein
MPIDVEVNLRIPRVKNPQLDENGYPIDHSTIRFIKPYQVPAIPKPGELLPLTTTAGHTFHGEVLRADWSDDRSLFVISCKYANRSIPADECAALFSDPTWQIKPLL